MEGMFRGCELLKSLPDISKWNTTNVTNMRSMFCGCKSLKSLPDISKWKLRKDYNTEDMFKGCDERIIPGEFEEIKESNCLIF